jgi:ribosome-associated protein
LTLTNTAASVLDQIERCLDETKAQDVVVIDLSGQSSVADYMVIASGQSQRQLGAMAARISQSVDHPVGIEGIPDCDWVCVDTGDVIVHLFKPEARGFYNIEKMWGAHLPQSEPVFV